MAIHLGYLRAGWSGLIVGGVCFILPAMVSVMILAWFYVRYGTTAQAEWLLYGVKPVVIAIIGQALWLLGVKAIKSRLTAVVGVVVVVLFFAGFNELLLLLVGGLVVMLVENRQRLLPGSVLGLLSSLLGLNIPHLTIVSFNISTLFLTFLKIGSVLYGSGYVLLAFLHADFVERLGWLTDQQLLDAIAIGQITPGPVFTTATFIGFILGGVPAAVLATIGIFLPGFVFVAISNPLIPRLRASPWAGSLLEGVNAASLGLMAGVTWALGRSSLIDPLTIGLALGAAILLFRFNINSTWLIAGGALVGVIRTLL
jgi:chromate transporter